VYDDDNRLIEVKNASGTTIASFNYDHLGRRISKTTSNGTIYYYYDGDSNRVLYETDANNNIVAEYTFDSLGNPATMTKNGVTYYYHVNGHGDVTALTDSSGNVVAEYSYDAWGNIISQTGTMASSNPYRYAGYRYDEVTGLYYLMARYYDSKTGRFITRDTFHGFENDTLSLNQYTYTQNNPVMYVDPSGHLRIISVDWAGSVFNTAVSWALTGSFGLAAIQAYIKKKGKEAARRMFYKTVKDKLIAWGAGSLAVSLGFIVDTVLDYYDIGGWIAKKLDSIDRKPRNGWIDI
jgi:RHS repeat-associated protein